ncbi:hypothetical protein [Rhodococcus ruber]
MTDRSAGAPRRRLAELARDTDALPLLFNVDTDGHEYATDLLDLAQETHP